MQTPRLDEIQAGKKFWGYLDNEIMCSRYALAAYYLRNSSHILEIGGYRDNVITNFLTGAHDSVTVYSLDAEFEEKQDDSLNGRPCKVRHIRDYFQSYTQSSTDFGLAALGLEVIGDIEPLYRLMRLAKTSVIEIAAEHVPCQEMMALIIAQPGLRVKWELTLDFSSNEVALANELASDNINQPFWCRRIYVIEPDS